MADLKFEHQNVDLTRNNCKKLAILRIQTKINTPNECHVSSAFKNPGLRSHDLWRHLKATWLCGWAEDRQAGSSVSVNRDAERMCSSWLQGIKPKLRHIIAFRKKTMDCTNESFRFDGEEAVGIKNTWSSSCVRSTLTRTAFTDHIRLSVGFGIQFNPLLKPDAMPTIFVHKRQGKVPKRGASA